MKKTLLCFLFLLPSLFYAQISSIIHCAGDNTFDLTSRYAELTKDIAPNQTITIKYYTKNTYAANDEYALEDPKHFVFNESSLQIHVRINTSGGASYMNSFLVILNYPLNVAYGNITNPVCGNSRLTIGAAGGRLPYQYSLDGVNYQSESTFDNVSPGSYTLYVKDNYGCIVTSTKVVDPIQPLTATALKTDYTCFGSKDGRIQVIPSGGKTPYAYSLDGGPFTVTNGSPMGNFTNLLTGPHTIILKDSIGCQTMPYTVQILEPQILTATAFIENQTAIINVSGGTGTYQYSLDGVNYQSSPIFQNLTPGNHIFMVKDSNGCIATVQATILPALTTTAVITKEMDCTANSNASIAVAAAGGQSPYTYSLNGGPFQVNNNFSNLIPGTYSITAKDAVNTISNPTAITINPLVVLTATALVTNPTNCSIGTITAMPTGGKAPYIYSFDGGVTFISSSIFGTPNPGTYVIIVKDSKGCLSPSITKTIIPAQKSTITAANTSILCAGETSSLTITANGDAPFQYSINDGAYTSSTVFTKLKAGNYLIKAQDANGCITALPHVISEPEIVSGDILIEGQTISVIDVKGGTGSYQYAIDNGTFQTNNVFTNVKPGIHNIRLKDSNNCEHGSFSAVIANENTLISTAAITKQINCNSNAQITVTAYGGKAPYLYSIDGGITYQESNVFDNLAAGTYTVNVQDTSPAVSDVNIIVIDPLVTLTATASHTPIVCRGSFVPVIVNAAGGQAPYQYSLKDDIYTNNNEFTDVKAGTYTIKVKDAYGCIFILPYVIQEPARMIGKGVLEGKTASIINVIGGSGSYLYSLNDGELQTNNVFPNLGGDFNYISVYDSLGCFGFGIGFDMTGPAVITSQIAITKTIDCESNAAITITAAGGLSPYSYSIDGGTTYQATNAFTNLIAGTYNATVKDANNNTKTNTFIIPPYSPLTTSVSYRNVSCIGSNDGSAEIIATGGIAPYLYSIDNGAYSSSTIFSSLTAGDYTLNVKDAAGCLTTSDIRITQPEAIFISATTTNTTASNNDGEITVTTTGGVAPYVYSITDNSGLPISPFQTSNVFTGLKVGLYTIQVKDANGCINSKTNIEIASNPNALLVSFITTSATCVNPVGTINITASGGIAPYQYSLDGVNYVSSNIFNVAPGTYTITVRDSANNLRPIVAAITQISAPSVTAAVTSNVLCKGDNTGIITAIAIGGQVPYSYSINGNAFNATNTFTNLRSGTYIITLRDANSCLSTTTIALTEPVEALSATAFPVNDQSIVVNAKGGTAPYKYFLQDKGGVVVAGPQDNGVFARLPLGLYGAQITDANGCGYIISGLNVIPTPPLSATVDVLATNCVNAGTITVNATGGFQPYYYSFDNGVTYRNSNVYSTYLPGNYAIKVRDYKNTIISLTASIKQANLPVITATATNISCKGETNGSITANVSVGQAPYTYSLNNGAFMSVVGNSITSSNLNAGVHNITVKDANGCMATHQVVITEPISPLISGITVQNQTITIEAFGGAGSYKFAISPDLDKFSSNNVFSQLDPGPYTVVTSDLNGCKSTINVLVDPPSPVINGLNKFVIELKPGLTLADIVVNGQNIRWYMSLNITDGSTSKTKEAPLPLSTVLVDGTTYYASQTINGIESKERLAVTVKLNGSLSTPDFVLPNFKYYPNPVLHNLTISNNTIIDEIEIVSAFGQSILSKTINSEHSEIDLSNVSSGVYLLKVKSEGKTKTVKIVKK